MKKRLAFAVALTAVCSLQAQTTISKWTFETSAPAGTGTAINNIAPEIGAGTASSTHAASATTYSSPAGNGSAHSLSANNWATGDCIQFHASSLGFTNISITYDQISSSTGPKFFDFAYSTDGTTFTTFASQYTVLVNASPNAWSATTGAPASGFSYDLSSIAALNDTADIYFRVVENSGTTSAGGGVLAAAGTDRIDNFTISGIVVPEPSTLSLLGVGVMAGMFLLARRNR